MHFFVCADGLKAEKNEEGGDATLRQMCVYCVEYALFEMKGRQTGARVDGESIGRGEGLHEVCATWRIV